MPRQVWALTQADASFLVDFSLELARRRALSISIAVVEAGGVTVALLRMDDTKLASVGVAERKAWTAALFQRPSSEYREATAPGGNAYGMLSAFPSKFVPMFGGQPLFVDTVCVGGIGISGASAEEDDGIAKAAVAAFLERNAK